MTPNSVTRVGLCPEAATWCEQGPGGRERKFWRAAGKFRRSRHPRDIDSEIPGCARRQDKGGRPVTDVSDNSSGEAGSPDRENTDRRLHDWWAVRALPT